MRVNMDKSKKQLADSENKEIVLEFLKNARIVKRQIPLLRGVDLGEKEKEAIGKVLEDLKIEISLFKS